jgi:pimeloyl-ACP methyl ester carboxylesterase
VRESALLRSLTIIEPNVPWLLEGPDGDEATLSWWRAENERVTAEAAGNSERRAVLWFELVNNRGPHAFDEQPDALRRMWLDNFNAVRPPTPPPSPLRCEDLRAITAPTLVLCAQFGMPYSRRIAQRVAECISSSRLVLVPSVTHFMTYQAPGQFNGTLLAFLDDH